MQTGDLVAVTVKFQALIRVTRVQAAMDRLPVMAAPFALLEPTPVLETQHPVQTAHLERPQPQLVELTLVNASPSSPTALHILPTMSAALVVLAKF